MPRPHIEFIFSQALSWRTTSPLDQRRDLSCKLLSEDSQNGEASVILRVPEGWNRRVTSGYQEEIYVLDGEIIVENTTLQRDGYARIEAKRPTQWHAVGDTTLLVFSNDAVGQHGGPADIIAVDTVMMPWDRSGVPEEFSYMGIARKALHVDGDTGNHRTWLLSVAPQTAPRGKQLELETHACAEEVFMLSGDITGPNGVMSAGAYFWRPADTLHGPFGSREGGLALSRFRHGDQVTTFHRERLPFSFNAPYRPQLPGLMESLKTQHGPYLERY